MPFGSLLPARGSRPVDRSGTGRGGWTLGPTRRRPAPRITRSAGDRTSATRPRRAAGGSRAALGVVRTDRQAGVRRDRRPTLGIAGIRGRRRSGSSTPKPGAGRLGQVERLGPPEPDQPGEAEQGERTSRGSRPRVAVVQRRRACSSAPRPSGSGSPGTGPRRPIDLPVREVRRLHQHGHADLARRRTRSCRCRRDVRHRGRGRRPRRRAVSPGVDALPLRRAARRPAARRQLARVEVPVDGRVEPVLPSSTARRRTAGWLSSGVDQLAVGRPRTRPTGPRSRPPSSAALRRPRSIICVGDGHVVLHAQHLQVLDAEVELGRLGRPGT